MEKSLRKPAASPALWCLDRKIAFLNHGSFGACPKTVLRFQSELRNRLEHEPISFLVREFEPALDEARRTVARFVGAKADNVVFVQNATTGINTVLRSLEFKSGDELLVTSHEYNATRNALDFVARQSGARVVVANLPFPLTSEQETVDAVLSLVTANTRLALLDHVTSQTGLVLPLERMIPDLKHRGVLTLIDGAHAPGMIPLNLEKLGADFYTGNCHKWMCGPKSAALLYVRPEYQELIRPLVISHGANSPRSDRSRFQIEFGWMGTSDPTAILTVPKAIEYLASLVEGGWRAIMSRNRSLAIAGRNILCEALKIPTPAPDSMIGSLASIPIADALDSKPPKTPLYLDALQEKLFGRYGVEVPVIPWPKPPRRLLRISAQLYNCARDYEKLAAALVQELKP